MAQSSSLASYRSGKAPNNWLVACSASALSILVVFLRLGLWRHDLRVPIAYWGDALYETAMVKALIEGPWNYHISRLGAPFGMDAVDFPIGCSLDFFVIKLLSFGVRNPFLLINLYWLLSIGAAAAFATLLFRYLEIRRLWAGTFGILYAISPWIFYRNISHLNLVHFIVPAAAYLGLSLAQWPPNRDRDSNAPLWRPVCRGVAICCAIGLTYIYWPFFACIIVAIGCLIGFVRTTSKSVLVIAVVYISVLGIMALADISASLVYWHRHGANSSLNYKHITDADVFALKIRQMITPIPHHPVPVMNKFGRQITDVGFPNDDNESASAALGAFGTIGLLILAGVAIVRPRHRAFGDERIKLFSAFVIALILVAQVGGFGSLFNVFVMHEFRCYTRVSPFITLFCLGAMAVVFDRFLRQKPPYVQLCVAGATVFAAAFDQIPIAAFPWSHEKNGFTQDQEFIRELEPRLPAGSMVFQLPNTGFPPDGPHERMGPYENARAYLHSSSLRWSWGAMDRRHHDWAKKTAAMPIPQLLEGLAFAGFNGLLLDRWGYSDKILEEAIAGRLGVGSGFETDGRWVFFDLRKLREALTQVLSPAQIQQKRESAMDPTGAAKYTLGTLITFGVNGNADRFKDSGWSGTEPRMTWIEGKSAVLNFSGLAPSRSLNLKMKAGGLTKPPALRGQPAMIYANGQKIADWVVSDIKEYTAPIPGNVITDRGTLVLELRVPQATTPRSLGINSDPRVLSLCVFDVVLEAVAPP